MAAGLGFAQPALAATAYPTTLAEKAPSVVTYGAAESVLGRLSLQGTPFGLAGESVSLYKRPAGTTTWTFVASHTTDAHGSVGFVVKPLKAEQFQLRHAKDSYTMASTSGVSTTKVAWRVQVSLSKAQVAPKAADAITATVSPNAKGASVVLQRKTSSGWTNVATKSLNTSSAAAFTFTAPTAAGKYDYRVTKAASSTYVAGTSPTLVLTVT